MLSGCGNIPSQSQEVFEEPSDLISSEKVEDTALTQEMIDASNDAYLDGLYYLTPEWYDEICNAGYEKDMSCLVQYYSSGDFFYCEIPQAERAYVDYAAVAEISDDADVVGALFQECISGDFFLYGTGADDTIAALYNEQALNNETSEDFSIDTSSWPTTHTDSWYRFVRDYGARIVQDENYNWVCLIGSNKLYWEDDNRWHYQEYYQFQDTDYFTDRSTGVMIGDTPFYSEDVGNWLVVGYYGLTTCEAPQEFYTMLEEQAQIMSANQRDNDIRAFQNFFGLTCYEEDGTWYVDTTEGIMQYHPDTCEWHGKINVADWDPYSNSWFYTQEDVMIRLVEYHQMGYFRYADGRDDNGPIQIYGVRYNGLPGSPLAEFNGIYNSDVDWPLFEDIEDPDHY